MNLKGVLFFYDWSYFQDAAPLLNQAKKYCFHGIWKWVIFQSSNIASQRGKGKKKKDKQRILNQNVSTTLFCQLSRPNLKQHRLPLTSQRSQRRLAAGGHQGCSWETGRGESAVPDSDCQDSLLNSACEMKALCGTSFPGCAKFSGGGARAPSTTYNNLTALLSSEM